MDTILKLYSTVRNVPYRKERFETILEPLHALIQLALIGFCPTSTKLSITNNLLFIQQPNWKQSVYRYYNNDNRDDLFFLFSVIRRYNKFYVDMKNKSETQIQLFNTLIELSKIGIDNLLNTYSNYNQPTLVHTLRMYKTLLVKPDAFIDDESSQDSSMDIDNIFIKISNIYTSAHYELLNNFFILIQSDKDNYDTYIQGLNLLMQPINLQIRTWIHDNIIF